MKPIWDAARLRNTDFLKIWYCVAIPHPLRPNYFHKTCLSG